MTQSFSASRFEPRQHLPAVLQRLAVDRKPAGAIPSSTREVLHSTGMPLEPSVRSLMEPRFGHDFSQVRVHTDGRAAESARAVNALAYTVGRDVVFGAGQYLPQTESGRKVIAHELAHVVQQGGAMPPMRHTAGTMPAVQQGGEPAGARPISMESPSSSRYERAAEAAANGVAAGQSVQVSEGAALGGLQRLEDTSQGKKADPDPCAGYEQDPESLSVETAKHFLDEVEPGAKPRLVKSTDCKPLETDPDRIECDVTFDDGTVIHVSIERKLHNVEGQRPVPGGREWCVYHFTCEGGQLQFQKKGCSANIKSAPPAPSGPDLVGSKAGAAGGGGSKAA